jgi:gas vesicle protein
MDTLSTEHVNGSTTQPHSRFAAGLILGALAGAAVALLFAPSTGQKLRGQIRDGAGKIAGKARDLYSEATHRAQQAGREVGREATRAAHDVAASVRRETVG